MPGRKVTLASTQNLYPTESREADNRGIIRSATLAEYERDRQFATRHYHQNGPLPPVGGFDKPEKEPAVGDKDDDVAPRRRRLCGRKRQKRNGEREEINFSQGVRKSAAAARRSGRALPATRVSGRPSS